MCRRTIRCASGVPHQGWWGLLTSSAVTLLQPSLVWSMAIFILGSLQTNRLSVSPVHDNKKTRDGAPRYSWAWVAAGEASGGGRPQTVGVGGLWLHKLNWTSSTLPTPAGAHSVVGHRHEQATFFCSDSRNLILEPTVERSDAVDS